MNLHGTSGFRHVLCTFHKGKAYSLERSDFPPFSLLFRWVHMDSYCEWEWISEAVSAGTISSNQLYTMQSTQHLAPTVHVKG